MRISSFSEKQLLPQEEHQTIRLAAVRYFVIKRKTNLCRLLPVSIDIIGFFFMFSRSDRRLNTLKRFEGFFSLVNYGEILRSKYEYRISFKSIQAFGCQRSDKHTQTQTNILPLSLGKIISLALLAHSIMIKWFRCFESNYLI